MEYNLIDNIKFIIKPWNCSCCSSTISNHPYYCKICGNQNENYSVLPEAEEYKSQNKIEKVFNVFGKINKIILPVLTCDTTEQFLQNIHNLYGYFKENKISGVFVLTTNIQFQEFESMYEKAKSLYPDFWIGINLVGYNIFKSLDFIEKYKPDGMWIDNSYLFNSNNLGICELVINQFKKINWSGLYFGGVMFKYTKSCNDFNQEIINIANKYMDVLTTSGNSTGDEISDYKLDFIHNNVNNICIGIASGIDKNNIKKISEKANIFIVRTSIVDSNNNISLEKLNNLIDSF